MKYSKPSITKIGNPLYLKHGISGNNYQLIRKENEGVKIADLIE